MGVYVIFLLTAVLAFALALYLAPSIIAAAHRYGILDRPDGNLKVQRDAVPYLGGLVVFLGMLAALAVTQTFNERLLALLLGASLIVSVGLVDDLGTLTPKDKFLGQVLCGVILVKGGISVQLEAVPSYVAAVASVLWMVTIINAFNIIDVSDGLCAGVGAVCAALLGAWQLTHGALAEAFLCAALFGALCGFLRHNWAPARMYLGDTGSMLIGTILGAVAMMSSWSGNNPLAPMVTPLAVLAVPLFDITFVVLVRIILGLRIYHGSPDHFAVRLRRHGWSAAGIATLAMVGGLCTGLLGLVAAYGSMSTAAVVGAGGILAAHVVGALLWRLDPRSAVTVPPPAAAQPQVPVDVVRPVNPPVPDTRPAVVHVITQLELGGAQRNTLFTVGHLDPQHWRASLVTGPGGLLDDEARALPVPVTFVPSLGRAVDPLRDSTALRDLHHVLALHARATQGPLVVHTHSSKAGILGRLAARGAGAAAVVHTVHGFGFHPGQHPAVRAAYIAAEHLVAPLTDAMVFVSQRDLDTARALHLTRTCRVELIHSGIDLAAFGPDPNARSDVRNELGISAGAPVAITTGNFKAQKNPLVGLAAFARVAAQRPDVVWIFVGDGELRAQFEREARDMGLWGNIRAVGWRKDIPRLLNAADVYMLSSDHEGLPRSVLEALRTGLPVAATNAGGTAEVVVAGTGLVVPVGDGHALGNAVLDLLEHPPQDVAGAAAPVLGGFDIHAMVRAQQTLYAGLLAR